MPSTRLADTTADDDFLTQLRSTGEQQSEPAESEPGPVYQPIGSRLDLPVGRPNAGQFGRSLAVDDDQDSAAMGELRSLGRRDPLIDTLVTEQPT